MTSAIIFDLDGTLTQPNLDFDLIRREIGLPHGPILESVEKLELAAKHRANEILNAHERRGAQQAELFPNTRETLMQLRAWRYPVAIMTRNARPWAQRVLDRFDIQVDFMRTREDGVVKPSPEPVWDICRQLHCDPAGSWVIGDYLFDIQSGKAAGCRTALMIGDGDVPPFAKLADFVIRDLSELLPLLRPGAQEGHFAS